MHFSIKRDYFFCNERTSLIFFFLHADFSIKDAIKMITVIDTLPKLLLSGAVWKIRNWFPPNGTADRSLNFYLWIL